MNLGKVLLTIFALLLLASCSQVKIKNSKMVTVAGSIRGGAFWAETLTRSSGSMTMTEFIEFLEPDIGLKDEGTGLVLRPPRAGAICQSARDFTNHKTALEQACALLKNSCTYEMKKMLKTIDEQLGSVKKKSLENR